MYIALPRLKHSKNDNLFIIATLKRFLRKSRGAILFTFIVYVLGSASLILANFDYIDDLRRSIWGIWGFNIWSRYSATALYGILELNSTFLLSIFPYSLFISLFFLSLASCALVYIIDKNLIKNKITLLASVSLGLSPYFLENLSYKFDSPFMALSVLVSIVPFLFLRKKIAFIAVSIVCLFIMLTSYQASSGIYIIISIFLSFQRFIQKESRALWLLFCAIVSYVIVGILFLCIYEPQLVYAISAPLPLKYIPIGIYKHSVEYFHVFISDFWGDSLTFLAIFVGLCVIFVAKATATARINKISAFALGFFVLFLMCVLSFGLYIVIIRPITYPRAFIGFGVLLSILALYSLSFQTKILKILSIALILALTQYIVMFANYYGQALKAHGDYQRFRFSVLASDLEHVLQGAQRTLDNRFDVRIIGDAGQTPYIKYSVAQYPLISRLIPVVQKDWPWSNVALQHYGIDSAHDEQNCPLVDFIKRYESVESAQPSAESLMWQNLVTLSDTYYHTIQSYQGNLSTCFIITFKEAM